MEIWIMMLGFNLVIPAVMLAAGKLLQRNVPKKINWIFGYRTAMSMKNGDTWEFAQKAAGTAWWKWGWITLAVTAGIMLLLLKQGSQFVSAAGSILMLLQLIPVFAVIPHTEKALRNAFDQDGNRIDSKSPEGTEQ